MDLFDRLVISKGQQGQNHFGEEILIKDSTLGALVQECK